MKQYRKRKIPNPGLEESVFLTWGCWLVFVEINKSNNGKLMEDRQMRQTGRCTYCEKENCLFGAR